MPAGSRTTRTNMSYDKDLKSGTEMLMLIARSSLSLSKTGSMDELWIRMALIMRDTVSRREHIVFGTN